MKSIVAITFLVLFTTAFAQERKIWFDKDWKKTSEQLATYYRLVTKEGRGKTTLYQVRDYYLDGTLQMSGAFSDKKMKVHQGAFVYYYEDGSVYKTCSYVNGLLEGPYLRYSEEGDLILESNYRNGKYHGTVTLYNSGRRLFKTGSYDSGEPVGHHLTYYDTGELQDDELYESGHLQGESVYYYRNGNLSASEMYDNDSLVSYHMYNEDGSDAPDSDLLERKTEFPGGVEAMKTYLSTHLEYPQSAIISGIEGKIYVSFMVLASGDVDKIKITKELTGCPECGLEVLRIMESMPRWIPGISHHRQIDFRFSMPITFKLQSERKIRKSRSKG